MVKVVVDTSVIIDHLRQRSSHFLELEEKRLSGEVKIYVPYVVVVELYAGQNAKRKKIRDLIGLALTDVEFIGLDFASSKKAIPGSIDSIIAAIAIEHDAQVATHNKKHFEQIKGLRLYDFLELKSPKN